MKFRSRLTALALPRFLALRRTPARTGFACEVSSRQLIDFETSQELIIKEATEKKGKRQLELTLTFTIGLRVSDRRSRNRFTVGRNAPAITRSVMALHFPFVPCP
jgi:hypothetical protein